MKKREWIALQHNNKIVFVYYKDILDILSTNAVIGDKKVYQVVFHDGTFCTSPLNEDIVEDFIKERNKNNEQK